MLELLNGLHPLAQVAVIIALTWLTMRFLAPVITYFVLLAVAAFFATMAFVVAFIEWLLEKL